MHKMLLHLGRLCYHSTLVLILFMGIKERATLTVSATAEQENLSCNAYISDITCFYQSYLGYWPGITSIKVSGSLEPYSSKFVGKEEDACKR